MTFRRGDRVEILPEYRDEGDGDFTWVVVGDEEKGRVDIQPLDHPLKLTPIYTVTTEQIRHAVQEL